MWWQRLFFFNQTQKLSLPKEANGNHIGEKNLETIINWVTNLKPIPEEHEYYPQIHGAHLISDKIWKDDNILQDNQVPILVDLNLGSNAVTSSKAFNSVSRNILSDDKLPHISSMKSAITEIVSRSRFDSGYLQSTIIERSEEIAEFIKKLYDNHIIFILGTDGQSKKKLIFIINSKRYLERVFYFESD